MHVYLLVLLFKLKIHYTVIIYVWRDYFSTFLWFIEAFFCEHSRKCLNKLNVTLSKISEGFLCKMRSNAKIGVPSCEIFSFFREFQLAQNMTVEKSLARRESIHFTWFGKWKESNWILWRHTWTWLPTWHAKWENNHSNLNTCRKIVILWTWWCFVFDIVNEDVVGTKIRWSIMNSIFRIFVGY